MVGDHMGILRVVIFFFFVEVEFDNPTETTLRKQPYGNDITTTLRKRYNRQPYGKLNFLQQIKSNQVYINIYIIQFQKNFKKISKKI